MKISMGSRGILNVVLILLVVIAVGYLWLSSRQVGLAQSTYDRAVQDRAAIARGALTGCQQSPQVAEALNRDGTCERAQQVVNTPLAATPPEIDYTRVKQILADLYRANPPRAGDTPTPAQLLPLVQQAYAANPPKDGKTPTDAELLTLIRQALAENPPHDGVDGKNGADGRDGVDGKNGAQGISIRGVRIARDDHDQCTLFETLFDPADGSTSEIAVAVPDQLCAPSAPPSSAPPVPLLPR